MDARKGEGFTFIEVIITVMVLGILVLAGLPMMNSSLTEARIQGAADEIVMALEFAQLSAISAGCPCRVTIDDSADLILVEQVEYAVSAILGPSPTLGAAVVEQTTYKVVPHSLRPSREYRVVFADESRFAGVDIQSAAFAGGKVVTFDVLGTPSASGSVQLTCGGRRVSLAPDGLAGKITRSN